MNREDIIRMVREVADKDKVDPYLNEFVVLTPEEIERFAALVVAAERSACAKVCEDIPLPKDSEALTHLPTIERCAAAIRARGEQ